MNQTLPGHLKPHRDERHRNLHFHRLPITIFDDIQTEDCLVVGDSFSLVWDLDIDVKNRFNSERKSIFNFAAGISSMKKTPTSNSHDFDYQFGFFCKPMIFLEGFVSSSGNEPSLIESFVTRKLSSMKKGVKNDNCRQLRNYIPPCLNQGSDV